MQSTGMRTNVPPAALHTGGRRHKLKHLLGTPRRSGQPSGSRRSHHSSAPPGSARGQPAVKCHTMSLPRGEGKRVARRDLPNRGGDVFGDRVPVMASALVGGQPHRSRTARIMDTFRTLDARAWRCLSCLPFGLASGRSYLSVDAAEDGQCCGRVRRACWLHGTSARPTRIAYGCLALSDVPIARSAPGSGAFAVATCRAQGCAP